MSRDRLAVAASKLVRAGAIFLVSLLLAIAPARAADPKPFDAAQLDQMLAPIALFPDALLAQVLMASTYPSDVGLAAEWAFANRHLEGDAATKAVQDKPWDPSVQSLVAFPKVLAMLGEDPVWVQSLGDAFLAQPGEVMDSVQFLRAKAKLAGNLESNAQQIITIEAAPPPPQVVVVNAPPPPAQIITIVPANPQVVFVPIYNPVYVFGPWWHPLFPPFFFPPPPRWGWGWHSSVRAGVWWGVGIGVTNAMWGGVNWRTRDVNINVNHWNNININNRIDSRDRDVSWRHNPGNRRGVPYRDAASRERFQNAIGDRNARPDFRGRDEQRARAQQALSDRVGAENVSRDALRGIDRGQLPDRGAIGDRGQAPQRPGGADRAASVDRGQVRDRAASVDRGAMADRAAGVDRSQLQNRNASAASLNRDNALRNANNAAQVRQQVDRGAASRQSMQGRAPSGGNVQRPSGGNVQRPSGGNVQRPSGGNVQRPAGGAGAGRRS